MGGFIYIWDEYNVDKYHGIIPKLVAIKTKIWTKYL